MDKMKICFIGIGSIAKRHINNIRIFGLENNISIQIDALRRYPSPIEGVDTVYDSKDFISNDYDAVFITNPTEFHLDTLKDFHDKSNHFFIEKPVVSLNQLKAAKDFRIRENALYYVASPLRYNSVIQWIKHNIDVDDILSIRSISSSYLPDWRPNQDYRDSYSAHKALGGGVSIDLIHEWDYLTYLFGWPELVYLLKGKISNLEIDSDDYAIYIGSFSNKIVELHLDYFGRKPIRRIELFTKEDTIIGDIENNKLSFLKKGTEIQFNEMRNDYYKREIHHFFEMIMNKSNYDDGFNNGINVLYLTQGEIAK